MTWVTAKYMNYPYNTALQHGNKIKYTHKLQNYSHLLGLHKLRNDYSISLHLGLCKGILDISFWNSVLLV